MSDKIVVEIDLASLVAGREEAGETFGGIIVDRAARILLDGARDSTRMFQALVSQVAEEEIRKQIKPAVITALAFPVAKTNTYGDPVGEPKPLRDHIIEIAREALDAKVGRDFEKKNSLLRALIAEEVERVLRRELQDELGKAKAEVLAAVHAQGAQVITETISRMAKT